MRSSAEQRCLYPRYVLPACSVGGKGGLKRGTVANMIVKELC